MFASLKNKIKEETGSDVTALPIRPTTANSRYHRGRLESLTSTTSVDDLGLIEQRDNEIQILRHQCNDLSTKLNELNDKLKIIEKEKSNLEKANELLEESLRVAQVQKDLLCEEQDKIQNFQLQEISKLKSLLLFREQEAIDRLAAERQYEQQIDNLKIELERVKNIEPMLDNLQDEIERLRHSDELETNNLKIKLGTLEEENRHIKNRLKIFDEFNENFQIKLNDNDKIKYLLKERKLLEQNLEEAHIHLSDIKSTWCAQNLSLETQVSRLSRQVAEETTEKRKAIQLKDEYLERIKTIKFDLDKTTSEIQQRDNKIRILEDEIDDLSSALRETRLDNDEEIKYLRNQVEQTKQELDNIKIRLESSDLRLSETIECNDKVTTSLRQQVNKLQEQIIVLNDNLEKEQQQVSMLKTKSDVIEKKEKKLNNDLLIEISKNNDLNNKSIKITDNYNDILNKYNNLLNEYNNIENLLKTQNDIKSKNDILLNELNDNKKTIKILNQRLSDMKKTLQEEIKNNNNNTEINTKTKQYNGGPIIMDEINFKYLKHVILKFLTSREIESRHLIRAISTLLYLNSDEEKLLYDTINWKMSWFGTKPDHGHGQLSFSIPPS